MWTSCRVLLLVSSERAWGQEREKLTTTYSALGTSKTVGVDSMNDMLRPLIGFCIRMPIYNQLLVHLLFCQRLLVDTPLCSAYNSSCSQVRTHEVWNAMCQVCVCDSSSPVSSSTTFMYFALGSPVHQASVLLTC